MKTMTMINNSNHSDNASESNNIGFENPAQNLTIFNGFLNQDGNYELPSAEWLLESSFVRDGNDLVLTRDDGREMVIDNYFVDNPTLSHNGMELSADMIDGFVIDPRMASIDTPSDNPIANVSFLEGEAVVVRIDGTRVPLDMDTPLYQGDVVETMDGGSVKLTFIDDTIMSLSDNARMALDKMIYNPADDTGETALTILKGNFLFISGKIAKSDPDDMVVSTPVATIGIRGTVVSGEIGTDGSYNMSVVDGAVAMVRDGQDPVVMSDNFATIQGNVFADGGLSNNVRIADVSEIISSNINAFSSLSDEQVNAVEAAVKSSIAEATGRVPDLNLGQEILAAAMARDAVDGDADADDNSVEEGVSDEVNADLALQEQADGLAEEETDLAEMLDSFVNEEQLPEPSISETGEVNYRPVMEKDEYFFLSAQAPTTTDPDVANLNKPADMGDIPSEIVEAGRFFDFRAGNAGRDLGVEGTDEAEVIITADGNDRINLRGGADHVHAGAGNDVIDSYGQNAVIYGGEGSDFIVSTGGDGSKIYGGEGRDEIVASGVGLTIHGGAGDDIIRGDSSASTIEAGEGNDAIHLFAAQDVVNAGAGDDTLYINNGVFAGDKTYNGGEGNDTALFRVGGESYDGTTIEENADGDVLNSPTAPSTSIQNLLGFEDITIIATQNANYTNNLNTLSARVNMENLSLDGSDRLTLKSDWDGGASSASKILAITGGFSMSDNSEIVLDMTHAGDLANTHKMLNIVNTPTIESGATLTIQMDADFSGDLDFKQLLVQSGTAFDRLFIEGYDTNSDTMFVPTFEWVSDQGMGVFLTAQTVDAGVAVFATDGNEGFTLTDDNRDEFKYFDGGEGGVDTFSVSGSTDFQIDTAGDTANTTNFLAYQLNRIDVLDLDGYDGNAINITADILKSIIDDQDHMTGGEGKSLVVKNSDAGDLNITGSSSNASETINGVSYQVYSYDDSDIKLYVEQ